MDPNFQDIFKELNKATQNFSGMMDFKADWLKYADLHRIRDTTDALHMIFSCHIYQALQNKSFVHSGSVHYAPFKYSDDKKFNPTASFENFKDEIVSAGNLRQICHEYRIDKEYEEDCISSSDGASIFINDNSFILLELLPTKDAKKVAYEIVTTDKEFFSSVKKIADKYLDLSLNSKNLYVVVDSKSGPELENIGLAGKELDKNNYTEDVITNFEYVSTQFSKKDPFGRLVILHGEPGTGKTFAIQGLIDSLTFSNVKFIFLPSDFLMNFNVAALTKLLVSQSDGASLVLIIEDGDDCLVPRGADNMSAVSKLLNLSDGFLGKMLDVRILITTNAPHYEIDSALQRPGRLCRVIHVGSLPPEQASNIVKNHTGKDIEFNDKKTLAEVYANIHEQLGDAQYSHDLKESIGFSK